MTTELVVDPVLRTRYIFSRSTDPDGTAVQHVEMWVDPGGGVTPHIHPTMDEQFTVVEGVCEFLGGREWRAHGVGETAVVPAGTRHAFRNRGDVVTHVQCEARPPETLQAFLEDVAGLSRAGKLTRFGLPKPGGLLASFALAWGYRDMVTLLAPLPPPAIQRLILPPLARLAERRGHRPGTFAQLA